MSALPVVAALAIVLAIHAAATPRPTGSDDAATPRAMVSDAATPRPTPIVSAAEVEALGRWLAPPIAGLAPAALHDTFAERRGLGRHEATDIVAPRGTPVLAVDDGTIAKLFASVPGGLTVYQFDRERRWCFYYAHLDGYAPGLREGALVRRGDALGFVGTTGNAGETPHLHFAIVKLGPEQRWWEGTPIDPYPLLRAAAAR